MGTTDDLVLREPVGAQRTEQAQGNHALLRVENVVYDSFEVESVKREQIVNFTGQTSLK